MGFLRMVLAVLIAIIVVSPHFTGDTCNGGNSNNFSDSSLVCKWYAKDCGILNNSRDRVTIYKKYKGDDVSIIEAIDGDIIWKDKVTDIQHHITSMGNPLFFACESPSGTSWYDINSKKTTILTNGCAYAFSIENLVYLYEGDSDDKKQHMRIYDSKSGKLIKTKENIEQNCIGYSDDIVYSGNDFCVRAWKDEEMLWENLIVVADGKKEAYKYQHSMNDDYLFIATQVFKGCCIYDDWVIKVIDKTDGETVRYIHDKASFVSFFVDDDTLYYSTGFNNSYPNSNHRNMYTPGETNTLHKMNTKTLEDEWTLRSGDYNYVISKMERIDGNHLYVLLFDDIPNDEPQIYNKIQCIDADTGEPIKTFEFYENIHSFAVGDGFLVVEFQFGTACYKVDLKNSSNAEYEVVPEPIPGLTPAPTPTKTEPEPTPPETKKEPDKKPVKLPPCLPILIPEYELVFKVGEKSYTVTKDDDRTTMAMDVAPLIQGGRTFIPARHFTEPLGGEVLWDNSERKVTCRFEAGIDPSNNEKVYNTLEMWIGKSKAKYNGSEREIDLDNPEVVPTIIDGRTMVPMRFLAESFGCTVEWDAETKEITLIYYR